MIVVLVLVVLALGVVAGVVLDRQRCARRLDSVLGPVETAGAVRFAEALEAVRRLQGDAEEGQAAAEVLLARLGGVLEGFTQAVLLFDQRDDVRVGNAAGRQILAGRHGDALVMGVVRELLGLVNGAEEAAERRVELAGPPKRTLELMARRLPDGDRLVVVEDVTERRRLEDVRRDFVANISHELKTPVGALSLLAETMSEEDDPLLTARLSQHIHREAQRLSAVIDDLLLLSRIESDEQSLAGAVDVDAVVAEAVERVAPVAAGRDIRIRTELHDGPLELEGDRRQLVSATFNLLENATKYSDDGSEVVVRTAPGQGSVLVEVEDHGIGIPTKDLERVFERFYRVDRARSRLTGGTGLGLAIVRHVVQNHGGTVQVRSREGEGSTFTLVLPARRRPDSPPGDVPGSPPDNTSAGASTPAPSVPALPGPGGDAG